MDSNETFKRIIARERKARKHAEKILEQKAHDLFCKTQDLEDANRKLEQQIAERNENLALFSDMLQVSNQKLTDARNQIGTLSLVAQKTDNCVIVTNPDGKIEWCNNGFTKLSGYKLEEVKGMKPGSFLQGKLTDKKAIAIISQALKELKPVQTEILNYHKKGHPYWVSLAITPVFDEERNVMNFFSIQSDITERKRTMEILKEREERFRIIFERAALGIVINDKTGKLLQVNDTFHHMLEYEPGHLQGKFIKDITHPDDGHSSSQNIQKLVKGEIEHFQMEKRYLTGSGQYLWCRTTVSGVRNNSKEMNYIIAIIEDITRQRQYETQLKEATRLAEEARLAQREFLANMSHELRTPLNAIIGMTHLMDNTETNGEQEEYLETIKYASELLKNITSDILDISKIESGEIKYTESELDLDLILDQLYKTFQFKIAEKPIDFQLHKDSPREALLKGDPTLINQILINLLSNAAKFTEKGKIILKSSILEESQNDIIVKFQVSDTGIGVAKEKQKEIFHSYRQLNSLSNSNEVISHMGVGLGLSIVKKLVEMHRGSISLTSEPGRGSTFEVILPLVKTDIPIRKPSLNSEQFNWKDRNLNILVVEDNFMNQKFISRLLDKWGLQYIIAKDGKEGVEFCKRSQYDLIFMDIRMPVMDGYEACKRIRNLSDNPNRNIPIIALTASALAGDREKAYEMGMSGHLTKPFTPIQLQNMLHEHLPESQPLQIEEKGTSDTESSLIDRGHLEMLYGNDSSYQEMMISLFLENTLPSLHELIPLVKQKSWKEAYEIVHRILPSYNMVGILRADSILKPLKSTLRDPIDTQDVESWASQLLDLTEKAVSELKQTISTIEN